MNKYLSIGCALVVAFSLAGCKSQETAYKKAYEKAKEREMAEQKQDYNSYTQQPAVTQTPVVTVPVNTSSQTTAQQGYTQQPVQQTYSQPVQQVYTQQPVQQTYAQPVQQTYQQPVAAQTQQTYQQPVAAQTQSYAVPTPTQTATQSYAVPTPAQTAQQPVAVAQPSTPVVTGNGKYQLIEGSQLKMFSVACGAFGSQANAENLYKELSQYGYAATIVLDLSRNLYRVLAMTSDNRADADQAKASLAEKYPSAWVLINK